MYRPIFAAGLILAAGAAVAQSVEMPPSIKASDDWVFQVTKEHGPQGWNQTDEDVAVDHISAGTVYLSIKQAGSDQPPVERMFGTDWSRSRDINGKQQTVNRPLEFPLRTGKKWDLEYTEANPNPQHLSETFSSTYTVMGWEDIQVPAGKFRALKIEAEGQWTAVLAPNNRMSTQAVQSQAGSAILMANSHGSARTTSGRLYKAFWYVPQVKNFVKTVEEYYGSNGTRSERDTQELISNKVAG